MFKVVPLDVSIGEGWKALEAQLPDAASNSIVLLTFTNNASFGQGAEVHVRLDVDKKMIIDAPPASIASKTVDEIVDRVADARRTTMRSVAYGQE